MKRTRLEFELLEARITPSLFLVTSAASSGAGSLAAELALANADNTGAEDITFAPADFPSATTITLSSTLTLTNIHQPITIDGTGAGPITISGGGAMQDIAVNAGVTAIFTSLTISNGFLTGGDGAGISSAGTLTLNNSTVSGCGIVTESATGVAAANGAGIYNTGSLTLNNSTVSGCSIYADVLNSFASNGAGGGIANVGGSLTLNNSVVSGCSVITIGLNAEGGGIYNSGTGTLNVSSSAVIDNFVQNNVVPATATNPGLATSATSYKVGDILTVVGGTGTAATLKVTAVNATTGQVIAASVNSGGNYTVLPTNPVATTDITTPGASGAMFHLTLSATAVTAVANVVGPFNPTFTITNPGEGYYAAPGVTLVSTSSGSGETYYTPGGGATATAQVAGDVVTGLTLTGAGSDYYIFSVEIGIPGFAAGGGIFSNGTASVLNSTISGNTASTPAIEGAGAGAGIDEGGGIYSQNLSGAAASLTVTNSVLATNYAAYGAGIFSSIFSAGSNNETLTINAGSATGAVQSTVSAPGIPIAASGASTSFTVANAFLIYQTWTANPAAFIQIDSEQMLVTDVNLATNTVTVTRGYNGTAPAVHLAGADVLSPNIYDNTSVNGAGIYCNGTATVNNGTIITANTASDDFNNDAGGGIYNAGTATLYGATISDNHADNDGGGIYTAGSNLTVGGILTTLAAPIADTVTTSITVASSAILMNQPLPCVIQIDNEQMEVTAVSGTTLTVTRGYGGTTAATHLAGANVIAPCIITGNNTYEYGGGIYSIGTTTVNDGTLTENYAEDYGGGIFTSGTTTVNNGTISENDGAGSGGSGIYSTGKTFVNSASISDNSWDGITQATGGTLTVTNSSITGNAGDGIWNDETAIFYASTIIDNTNTFNDAGEGGGIYNSGTGTVAIGGSMTTLAAAVGSTTATSITVASSALFAAQTLPCLIQIDNEQMQVTAVNGTTLTVTRGYGGTTAATHLINAQVDAPCFITANTAEAGGGIYSQSTSTVTVTDSTLSDNSVSGGSNWGGGGIWMESQTGTLILQNSSITNNTATGLVAGGLLNFGTATITDCIISGNSSTTNAGAIDNVYATMTIVDSTIDNNTATGNGGGLANGNGAGTALLNLDDPNATLTVEGGTIDGNSAGGDGGGIYDASGTMTVENSGLGSATISGNSAVSGAGIYNTVWSESTDVNADDSPWNNSGYAAPGSATLDITLPTGTNRTVTLSAAGTITLRVGPYSNDPDGTGDPLPVNIPATNGLSGIVAPNQGAILGVFLNGAENGTQTAPASLNFDTLTTAFTTLAPAIDQVFFAGDGKTGDGTGAVQQFVVPNGATILVLGIAEGTGTGPNYGSGYQVGDILTVPGGTGTAATLKVTAISAATGQVNGVSVLTPGNYTVDPAAIVDPTDTTTPSANGTDFALTYVAGQVTAVSVSSTSANAGHFTSTDYATTQGVTVTDATISDNTASSQGGGIYNAVLANIGSPMTVQGSTVSANSAVDGGGIYSAGGSLSVLGSSMIQNNTASTEGGGLALGVGGSATVDDSLIGSNSAPSGGGIYSAGTLTVQDGASIQQNTASTGGGLDLAAGSATVTGSTVAGNSASGIGGGIDNAATLSISNATIATNTSSAGAAGGGGGVENDGTLSVTDSTLSGNSTNGAGGAVRNTGTATFLGDILSANTATGSGAGAISDSGVTSNLTVMNSTVSGNSSSVAAGGIANAGSATLIDSTLTGNTGASAGAVSSSGTLTVVNCTITGNSGTGTAPGGMLIAGVTATLLNTIVAGNTSTTDPDIETSAGAITATYSLIGNTTGSGIAGGTGNILNPSNSGIGTLGSDGGTNAPTTPPQTIPLVNGSPAIDTSGAVTTLAAAVTTTGATTITVSAAGFFAQSALTALASGSYFTIQVDGEQMQVTAMTAAGVMTVVRGANGTTAATHLANAPVYLVSDERGDLPAYAAAPQINMGALAISNVPYTGLAILPPSNVAAGQSFTITVDAINSIGTAVGGYNGPVTLALGTNPSGSTLGGTLTVSAVNGVATFSGLTLNKIGSGYTVTASAAGLTGATSSPFNVTASQLTITIEPPASVVAGTGFGMTVKATDALGDVDTSYTGNVTLTLASNPGGSTLGGTVTATCVAGVASFSGLSLDNVGSGYTIQAASAGVTSATSTAIQVTASQLTFTVEPPASSIVYNTPFSVTVAATDANGNVDPTFSGSITLTLASNPGASTLSGTTTVTAVNGVATFPNLSLNNVGIGYTLQAAGGSFPAVISSAFEVFGDHFAFTFSPPATVTAGELFPADVTAQLEDHNNNPLATPDVPVSLTLAGATLLGTTFGTTNSSGFVSFSDLAIDTAGTFIISATSPGVGNASAPIVVTAGPASSIAFVTQPSGTTAGTTLNPVTVQALDQYGNDVPGATIALAISANTLNGTLALTTNASGQAAFTNLSVDTAGTYTLTASTAGVASVSSQSFIISAAAAKTLTFLSQPNSTTAGTVLNPITVLAEDQFGNVTAGTAISIALSTGVLSAGTPLLTTNAAGQVVYTDLAEDFVGTYTLTASAAGPISASSQSFVISPLVSSATLSYLSQPTSTTAGVTINPITVQAADKYGNPLISLPISIALTLGTLSTGTTPLTTGLTGQVVFSDLSEDTAGTYSLKAAAAALPSIISNPFTISAAAPATLTYLSQPNSTTAGTILNGITVAATDQYGNPTSATVISIGLVAGSLSTATTPLTTGAAGQVLFSDLSEDVVGTYTLVASASGVTSIVSNPFVITPLVSSAALTYLSQPISTTAGSTLNAVTVQAADKFGNPLTGLVIGIAISPGTLSAGTTPLTANSLGQVVFGDLVENKTGNYTLTASATGLASASSNPFTISVAPGWTLTYVTQPTTVAAGVTLSAITLLAVDSFGNAVPGPVSITLSSGTLSGTTTAYANSSGQVIYSGLSVPVTGLYTLTATLQSTSAVSNPFAVTSSADKLTFVVEPTSTTAGASLGQVTLKLTDPAGDLLPGVAIGVSLSGGVTLAGTAKGTTGITGQAIFGSLSVSKTGTYTLSAAAGGIPGATSTAFTISAAAVASLGFITPPNNTIAGNTMSAVTVKALDLYGNIVSGVSLSMSTSPGKIGGTLVAATNSAGLAVFSGLVETTAATCVLTAAYLGVSITSTSFIVSPASPSTISFLSEPISTMAGATLNPISVKVTDKYGNATPKVTVTLTTSINTVSGTTVLSTNAVGQAVFTNLYVTKAATGYTLAAAASGMTGKATSSSFTIAPGAGKMSFLTEPASTTAGSSLGSVAIRVIDQYGNPLPNLSVAVRLSTGTLNGTTTSATNTTGEVIFTNLAVTQPGTGYTLIVTAPGATAIMSSAFTISAAPPPHLAFSTPPVATAASTVMKPVIVQIDNANGTPLDEANVDVTVKLSTGSLSGTLTVLTNSAGQAEFSTLKIGAAGTYTLTATAVVNGQNLTVTSASFSVS